MLVTLEQVFESLDADGSGELTMVEVQAAFRVQVRARSNTTAADRASHRHHALAGPSFLSRCN